MGQEIEKKKELDETVKLLLDLIDQAEEKDTIHITSDFESCLFNGKDVLIMTPFDDEEDEDEDDLTRSTWNAELLMLFTTIKEKAKEKGIKFQFSFCSTTHILGEIANSKSEKNNDKILFENLFELNGNKPILQVVAGKIPKLLIFKKGEKGELLIDTKIISEIVKDLREVIPTSASKLLELSADVGPGTLEKRFAIIFEAYYRKFILNEPGAFKIIFFDNDNSYIVKLDSLLTTNFDRKLDRPGKEILADQKIEIKSVHIKSTFSPIAPEHMQKPDGGIDPRSLLLGFDPNVKVDDIKEWYTQLMNDNIKDSDLHEKYIGGLFTQEELIKEDKVEI
jgi:hypothetical protein